MPGMIQPKRTVEWFDDEAKVTVWPIVGGPPRTMFLKITPEQWDRWQVKGEYIQNVMPNLTDEEREFLMSGLDQAAWDEMWKEED